LWIEGLGAARRPGRGAIEPDPNPEFWVFRAQAWPFGYNAPDIRLFGDNIPREAKYDNDAYLPEDADRPNELFLDTVYPGIVEGGWLALVTSRIDTDKFGELRGYDEYVELYPVVSAVDTSHMAFLLAGRSTKVTLDSISEEQLAARLEAKPSLEELISGGSTRPPEHIEYFPVRGTVALVASERIPLAEVALGFSPTDVASSAPVEGTYIELDGRYPDLRRGRTLLVSGMIVDEDGRPLSAGSEAVVVSVVETTDERTTIRFATAMSGRYERASVVIYGNVAQASHGESVRGEILGDGDAAKEFPQFALKKGPVTYVPAPGSPGGVASTLQVRVDGVRWTEVDELYGQPSDARVYVTRRDVNQKSVVRAGDGRTGGRVTSGRNNVTADYRVGLGPDGNVGVGSLRTLLKKPLGLKGVSNPDAAAGGARAEDPSAVKKTAPGTVRTFGRVVSIRDFEDAALEYVGVAKARAQYVWDGEGRVVNLIVAGDDGMEIDVAASGLLGDLDARRDQYQPLVVRNFAKRPVVIRASVIVDSAYVAANVVAGARSALAALLAFDAVGLGEAISLSDIDRAIQGVAGVVSVDVDELRFKTQPAGRLEPRLLVAPDQLVWVEDPDDVYVGRSGDPIGATP
jgi:predicted phage baseplate assembly protein